MRVHAIWTQALKRAHSTNGHKSVSSNIVNPDGATLDYQRTSRGPPIPGFLRYLFFFWLIPGKPPVRGKPFVSKNGVHHRGDDAMASANVLAACVSTTTMFSHRAPSRQSLRCDLTKTRPRSLPDRIPCNKRPLLGSLILGILWYCVPVGDPISRPG
jgi:hypothetical protein